MEKYTNTATLKPVKTPWQALNVVAVRNQCKGWLTGNSKRISNLEQLKWFYTTYRKQHKDGKINLYLFINGDEVYGYGLTSKALGMWTVTGCLWPEWRGYGLGERLFRLLIDSIEEDQVWLEVFSDNERAVSLYRKLGFEEVGGRSNIIVMRLKK